VADKLFATKPVDDFLKNEVDPEHRLKRSLRAVDLVMLGVGAIVGVGIFVLTGQAAASYAGPGILLSFIFAAVASGCAAVCYSEMAAMIPMAGSAYTFTYATLGEFVAWIIGWDLVLEYSLASATVSAGWSGYVMSFLRDFGIHIPARLSSAPYIYDAVTQGWVSTGAVVNLPAVLIVALVTILLVVGIRESANVNTAIVFIKIGVIVTFILAGVAFVHRANWHPFIPPNSGQFGHYGWSGVLRGAAVVFVAYIGFDAVSTAAQEARNPQRDMPVGIIGSLIICTLLYIQPQTWEPTYRLRICLWHRQLSRTASRSLLSRWIITSTTKTRCQDILPFHTGIDSVLMIFWRRLQTYPVTEQRSSPTDKTAVELGHTSSIRAW